jgi:phosphatidylglycerophosphatase A
MKNDPYIPPVQTNQTNQDKKLQCWYPTTFNIWNALLILLLILELLWGIIILDKFVVFFILLSFFLANQNYWYAIRNGYNENWALGLTLIFGLIGYFVYRYFRKEKPTIP